MTLRPLDLTNLCNKTVLLRADLNVSMKDGQILDTTRIEKIIPTLQSLRNHQAKIIVVSHLGRPKGKPSMDLSLKAIARCLEKLLGDISIPVVPLEDISPSVSTMKAGEVMMVENIRFYPGEEANDLVFAHQLAKNADIFVNEAFSVSHRAHASVEGVTHFLPSYAGPLLREEVETLSRILKTPHHPVIAIVAGAKVSTKIDLLTNLSQTVDTLVIGGGLAHTFLVVQGHTVGKDSLYEPAMTSVAESVLTTSKARILLPTDVRVASDVTSMAETQVVPVSRISDDRIIVDMGDETVSQVEAALAMSHTLIWNGAVGIFEVPPFDQGTMRIAETVARLTQEGHLFSVAGGGETIAALNKARVMDKLSYVSTAGGAFLEFLEGRSLPGVAVLLE